MEAFELNDLDFLHERLVSGILALDFTPGTVRKFCDQYSLPLVSINNAPRHPDQAHEVFSNNRKALADAVAYLCGYGHRRIGYIYASDVNQRRLEAFQEACRESGVSTGDACFHIPSRTIDRKHCVLFHGAVREVIAQKLTAVILTGEAGGPNLLAALREFGLRVPEDLSVIAWETLQVSEYLDPPLTTFEQDFQGMATGAFGILEELMNRRPAAASSLQKKRRYAKRRCRFAAGGRVINRRFRRRRFRIPGSRYRARRRACRSATLRAALFRGSRRS